MQFPRYFVYIFFLCSCVVSAYVGKILYLKLSSHFQDLGLSTSLTVLDKNFFEKIHTSNFPHFYELKPNVTALGTARWFTEHVEYTINADGIHSEKDFTIPAIPNTFRIITLGDSFTFGQFVNTNENYSERLVEMLRTSTCEPKKDFEVINLGVQGYDIGYEVEHFSRKGVKYQPNLVIWLINTHNVIPVDDRDRKFDAMLKALTPEQKEALKNSDDYLPLFAKAANEVTASLGKDGIHDQLKANLERFNQLYQGPLLVLVNDNMKDPDFMKYIHTAFGNRPSTYVSDSFPNLAEISGEHLDKHPNRVGHLAIASELYRLLQKDTLLPCEKGGI